MSKKWLSAAAAAMVAANALADVAPGADPTVLEAALIAPANLAPGAAPAPSGLTVSGYLDGFYTHADRNLRTGFSDRVFDSRDDSLSLHKAGLQLADQPAEGFGGLLSVTAGAPALASYPYKGSGGRVDPTQAYAQYAGGPWTLLAGKFATLMGSEVIAPPTNSNASASILFGAIAFTHTGARATYAPGASWSLIAGLNNGWDQIKPAGASQTAELGATYAPVKALNLALADYVGRASAQVGGAASDSGPAGARNALDLLASFCASDAIDFGAEYLKVRQGGFAGPAGTGPIVASYSGEAVYASALLAGQWRLALRAEDFDDPDGFHFGQAGTNYREATATASWLASGVLELRAEVRADAASRPVFTPSSGAMPDDRFLRTYALEALLKF